MKAIHVSRLSWPYGEIQFWYRKRGQLTPTKKHGSVIKFSKEHRKMRLVNEDGFRDYRTDRIVEGLVFPVPINSPPGFKLCPACDQENDSEVRFCWNCGEGLS